jgi:L-alanine-DL-glutamate epimerase-like enolase superfamily enzyme
MSKNYTLKAYHESWPIRGVFNIAHGSRTESDLVICEISDGENTGYGECYPYQRYNETVASVLSDITKVKDQLLTKPTRDYLMQIMPAGGGRCAIDLALWDLESKQTGRPIWSLAGLCAPKAIASAYTISIGSVAKVTEDAIANKDKKILKLKLAGDAFDKDRIKALSQHAPNSKIIIDANESWSREQYNDLIEVCQNAGVAMIEQPFKANSDDILTELNRPIPICADESCHTSADLKGLVGKYDMINIKLDKTGGLTEALNLLHNAEKLGFKIMVGCMVTTSLSIRPAYYLAQTAEIVDIDGFALLEKDREGGLNFQNSQVSE